MMIVGKVFVAFILVQANMLTFSFLEHRRIFRREFETSSAAANRAHELHAARRLLQRLLTSPNHAKELRL